MAGPRLTRPDMLRLFDLLDAELAVDDVQGELYLVGGAVMCLALDARHATRDVDGYFRPTGVIRQAAGRVAAQADVPDDCPPRPASPWRSCCQAEVGPGTPLRRLAVDEVYLKVFSAGGA